ncbi:MAG: hypothetical protein JRN15_03040 [Nitrososphaerota archaeon]|nr:hypothetical protein [Nitrososphaerota archaeon]
MTEEPKSRYEKILDDWIDKHVDSKLGRREPFDLSGKRCELDVFRLPLKLLRYNIRNGRFAAQLLEYEARIGRHLSAEDEDDKVHIEKLLLTDSNQTTYLEEDIKRVGQLRPGVITIDGAIIDGNRRAAVMRKLSAITGDEKYEFFEAVRLPSTVSPSDLWKIEAGIQLSTDLKVSYGPINELLKIKEGKESGLGFNQIALVLGGSNDANSVRAKLDRLKLIEQYLRFVGKPGYYLDAERRSEHFIDLQHVLAGKGYKVLEPSRKSEVIEAAFKLIFRGVPHMRIRSMRKIVDDRATLDRFLEEMNKQHFMNTGSSGPEMEPDASLEISSDPTSGTSEDEMFVDSVIGAVEKPAPSIDVPPTEPTSDEDEDDGESDVTLSGENPNGTDLKRMYEELIDDALDQVNVSKSNSKPSKVVTRILRQLQVLEQLNKNQISAVTPDLLIIKSKIDAILSAI